MKREIPQKEQINEMFKRPIPKKRIGIIRLEMVKEDKVLYGMRRFSKPEEIADMIRPLVLKSDREMILVLSLDCKLQPMALEIVAVGGVDCCAVDIKNLRNLNEEVRDYKMTERIATGGLSREEWLDLRKRGLGGSDAGAICGLNPYVSPISVFYDKTREGADDYDNEAMRQGRDLEEYVARRFVEATGRKVRRSNMMYWSREFPFMFANVDRMLTGEHAGLECKTASAYSADKWKDGRIPAHYELQCHHYMAVTGADAWYLAVVILGKEFQYHKLERDEELIRNLRTLESNFWYQNVVPGIMPEPDGSQISEEIISRYYPNAERETAILPAEFNEKLERRSELVGLIARMEMEQRKIEQEIKLYMKSSELAANECYRITWNEVATARLDTKQLKQELPKVYERYLKKTQSRRFYIKAA
ncbi:MAG: YqaJ viral recombinase family protein [Lachnospiraceae bacterium]